MMTFECKTDDAETRESWSYYPQAAEDGGTLEQTGFYAFVYLLVDGRNVFRTREDQTANVPLLAFIRFAREKMRRIQSGEVETVNMGCCGSMSLQRRGRRLMLSTSFSRETAEVEVEEAVVAIQEFAEQVRRQIEVRTPQMTRHPNWAEWFPARGG
jgi:hypothetical protein